MAMMKKRKMKKRMSLSFARDELDVDQVAPDDHVSGSTIELKT